MMCPDEFTLAQYADGELPEEATRELDAHHEVCAVCREQVAALRAENRLLAQSLQGIDWWEPERRLVRLEVPGLVRIGSIAAAFVGVAVLLHLGYDLVMGLELPAAMDWLFPLNLSGQMNWAANGFFYIIGGGSSMMTSLVNEIGFALLSFLVLGGLLAAARRVMGTTVMVGIMALMVVAVLPGYAIDIRKGGQGQKSVTVAPGETIDDTLVVFGESVNVRGTITGDLIAFARQVNVQGTVQGNVIGFAQRIDITGNVEGDIFGFGQSVQANGHVGHSLWGFGQTLDLGPGSKLEHDATMFGSDINVDGDVGHDLTTFGASLDVGGVVGRDVRFRGQRLLVHTPSKVGRDLVARVRSEKDVQIDSGVTIIGKRKVELEAPTPSKYLTLGFYVKQALRICAAFLTGLLLLWLFPSVGRSPLSTARSLLASGGIGFLAAVATPIAAIILAITLIGLPIALVSIVLWLLGLYLAKIVVARCVGGAILGTKDNGMKSTALALLVGLIVIIVAVNLPYIGGVLDFLLILIGLGALVLTTYRMSGLFRRPNDAAA